MYCPRCGSEYREGYVRCADCDRELVATRPDPANGHQAATQVTAQAVAFGPKALAVVIALVVSGPFLLGELVDFTHAVLAAIGEVTP